MAIDPLAAKLLAQAAADEESRRRMLILILAPVLALLLLIAFILYLITSPFATDHSLSSTGSWGVPVSVDVTIAIAVGPHPASPIVPDVPYMVSAHRSSSTAITSSSVFMKRTTLRAAARATRV